MKIAFIIILWFCSPSFFLPKKVFDGFGEIRIGKTASEIFDALHVKRADIVEGQQETLQQFRGSVSHSVVHVQYNPASRLIKEIEGRRARYRYSYDTTSTPESYVYECALLNVYYIPVYQFDGITLNELALIFYNDKLVRIAFNLFERFCSIDSVADYFQKKYPDSDYYNYTEWDADACGAYPGHYWWRWPKNDEGAAIKAVFHSDDVCTQSGNRCESFFEITDDNFLKEMKSLCPDVKE